MLDEMFKAGLPPQLGAAAVVLAFFVGAAIQAQSEKSTNALFLTSIAVVLLLVTWFSLEQLGGVCEQLGAPIQPGLFPSSSAEQTAREIGCYAGVMPALWP